MKLRTVALTCALAVGTTLAASGGAVAQVYYGYDPSGDVRYVDIADDDPGTVPPQSVPAPQRENGDIIRTRISHASSKVRVSVQFRALTQGGLTHFHRLYIGSDQGRFTLNKVAWSGNWTGENGIVIGCGDTPCARSIDEPSPPYRCPGLYVRIDYANDRYLAEIPRACLSNPKWIKVRFTTEISVDTASGYRIYTDADALSPKILPSFTQAIAVS